MNFDLGLKKINTLEQEKINLLVKFFDANELINIVKIENMSLIEKDKSLEFELSIAKEQLNRSSTSKLDNMLNVQKSISDKTRLGFVDSGSTSIVHPPKFVPTTSTLAVHSSLFEVKVPTEGILASRRNRVDLSESKPKNLNQSRRKKKHKP